MNMRLALIFLPLLLVGCGDAALDNGEDFGDILSSPSGLLLTEDEHEAGWGHSECTTCHHLENIHLEDRSGLNVDIEAIHDQTLDDGVESCVDCHGTNGVP